MAFIVTITLSVLDVAYTVANMQVCSTFGGDSQAVAGSIFSVATRVRSHFIKLHGFLKLKWFIPKLGTSIGLAVTASIANSVSEKYNKLNPELASTDPEVLMAGFRAAGWTSFASLVISMIIALVGMWGIGIVGQPKPRDQPEPKKDGDLELAQGVNIPDTGEPTSRSSLAGIDESGPSTRVPSIKEGSVDCVEKVAFKPVSEIA